jgi:hypothetical protein
MGNRDRRREHDRRRDRRSSSEERHRSISHRDQKVREKGSRRYDDHSPDGRKDRRGEDTNGGGSFSKRKDGGRSNPGDHSRGDEDNPAAASAKPKSGIFQHLAIPSGAASTTTTTAAASNSSSANNKNNNVSSTSRGESSSSSSVNTAALRRVLADDQRSGDRNDRRRLEGAHALLHSVGAAATSSHAPDSQHSSHAPDWGGRASSSNRHADQRGQDRGLTPVHLKTVTTVTASGASLRDSYRQVFPINTTTSLPLCLPPFLSSPSLTHSLSEQTPARPTLFCI